MAWLALPKFGLSTVFVVSFVSATLLPLGSALAVMALTLAIAAALRWLALRQIGGQTGDVLGSVCALTEAAVLLLLCGH